MPLTLEMPSRERLELTRRDDDCLVHRRHEIRWREHAGRHHNALWLQLNHPSMLPPQNRALRPKTPDGQFDELADQWEQETAFESVVTRKALHPAYQRIIGMGAMAVPPILKRLQRKPQQWFWALTAITGEDPALGETALEGASNAWLRWGRERGLIGD